jgi:sigma-B regulation protein RsbU (phosphoserine phosphatase)
LLPELPLGLREWPELVQYHCMLAMLLALLFVITREAVRGLLRHDLPDVLLAGVFIAAGLATIVLYRLKQRSRDLALLWFGLFAILYGVRLLSATDAMHIAFDRLEPFWIYFGAAITYTILLPLTLLLREIFPQWRVVLRWLLWVLAVFAVAGIVSDAVQRVPFSLTKINNVIVLLGLTAFLIAVFRHRGRTDDTRTLRVGLLIFSFTLLVNNLGGVLGKTLAFNPEPLGLLALLVSLGRLLARRAFRNEERLVELDKELEIARRIQASILPRHTPRGPHWDIAAQYLPMTAVAGDFYDFLIVDEQRTGILVADVSGHGVPAALIASMVKVAIAAQLPHADNPAEVLSGMNRTLCGNLQGQYVTAAYLYLDLAARKMRYAAAGHPALFWCHAGGEVEEVLENGLMLGLFPNTPYTARESDLQPGDRFLLYTDGLLEAADPAGEFFGGERAKGVLAEAHAHTAHELVVMLLDRVARWSDSVQDDLTLIAVGWPKEAA